MKILVTGGAGFIGSHIQDTLIKLGHKVCVVDNLSTGFKNNLNPKAKFYHLDIQSPKVKDVFSKEKFDAVFHEAAQIDLRKSLDDPIKDAQINILGSINILENCKNFKVKKIIFASTGGAMYGEANIFPTPESYSPSPLSPYGIEKLTVEYYLHYYFHVFGMKFIALRYANVYGPRQNPHGEAGVVAIFINKLFNKQIPVINGDGKNARDYVYVEDVVSANILALKSNEVGYYNIGTGIETNVNQIFQKIEQNVKSKIKPKHGPAKPGEQRRSSLDARKAAIELDWIPEVDLSQGIKKTVDWFADSH